MNDTSQQELNIHQPKLDNPYSNPRFGNKKQKRKNKKSKARKRFDATGNSDGILKQKAQERCERNKQKNINKALGREANYKETEKEALKAMKRQYNLHPNSKLYIDKPFSSKNVPITQINKVEHNNAIVFPNDTVYSLMKAEKKVFEASILHYKVKGSNLDGLRTIYYAVSYIDDSPYICRIDDFSTYEHETFKKYSKNLNKLVSKVQPHDFSICGTLIIGKNLTQFDVYRLDKNNANKTPHENWMSEDRKILSEHELISGSHEHLYDEKFAVIFYDSYKKDSYDAKPVRIKKNKPTISKQAGLRRIQEVFNVDLSMISSGENLKEAYNDPNPKPFEYSNIEFLSYRGK